MVKTVIEIKRVGADGWEIAGFLTTAGGDLAYQGKTLATNATLVAQSAQHLEDYVLDNDLDGA